MDLATLLFYSLWFTVMFIRGSEIITQQFFLGPRNTKSYRSSTEKRKKPTDFSSNQLVSTQMWYVFKPLREHLEGNSNLREEFYREYSFVSSREQRTTCKKKNKCGLDYLDEKTVKSDFQATQKYLGSERRQSQGYTRTRDYEGPEVLVLKQQSSSPADSWAIW